MACCFYLSTTSLLFMRHGWFLNVAITFFFSSTCSFRASISPSDSESSSESESEDELIKGKTCHDPGLWQGAVGKSKSRHKHQCNFMDLNSLKGISCWSCASALIVNLLLCCEATEIFCGLQNFNQLSIHMGVGWYWLNIHFWVNISFNLWPSACKMNDLKVILNCALCLVLFRIYFWKCMPTCYTDIVNTVSVTNICMLAWWH